MNTSHRGRKLPRPWGAHVGFTLIEMLVVLSLVALLVMIAMPRYVSAVERAKEQGRQQNLATLRDALDQFRADQGRYAKDLQELVAKQYVRRLPIDPVTGSSIWVQVESTDGTDPGVYDVAPPAVLDVGGQEGQPSKDQE